MDDDDIVCISSGEDSDMETKPPRTSKKDGKSRNSLNGSLLGYFKKSSPPPSKRNGCDKVPIVAHTDDGNSSDDCQVIEEVAVPPKRKRPSQESTEPKEVKFPGINLSLIANGGKRTKLDNGNGCASQKKTTGTEKLVPDDRNVAPVVNGDQDESEGDDAQEIELDEEEEVQDVEIGLEEPEEEDEEIDYASETKSALSRFLNEFTARKPPGSKKQIEKAKTKAWEAFKGMGTQPSKIHQRLKEEIDEATQLIRCTHGMFWITMKKLINYMSPIGINTLNNASDEDRGREKEHAKLAIRIKYEQELGKIQRRIRKLEGAPVDWDDDENDHNSSYILADKYKAKLIRAYYTLCDLSNCNRFTGRPVQTKIILRKQRVTSGYTKIDDEVEKWVNKQGFMFAPDYTDILECIGKVNDKDHMGLGTEEVEVMAQKLFEGVVKIIKKRREKDFKMSMLALLPLASEEVEDTEEYEVRGDPADEDEELRNKLEENEALKSKESDVIAKFAKMAEDKECKDDDDGEENLEDDEEEDDDEEEKDTVDNLETIELTEDEDEVPESVGNAWKDDAEVKEIEGGDRSEVDDAGSIVSDVVSLSNGSASERATDKSEDETALADGSKTNGDNDST